MSRQSDRCGVHGDRHQGREQIIATFTIGSDQVAGQGIDGPATTDRVAIVGGTGRHDGATGIVTAAEQAQPSNFGLAFKS
jgi:hypothetical protein